MLWYYKVMGVEHGPISTEQLRIHIKDRKVSADTLVRSAQSPEWVEACSLTEFFAPLTSAPVLTARTNAAHASQTRRQTSVQSKQTPVTRVHSDKSLGKTWIWILVAAYIILSTVVGFAFYESGPLLFGGIVGGVGGGMGVLIFALVQHRRNCQNCGEPVPRFRKPANAQQALWGGCTCTKCGCEMDRDGNIIGQKCPFCAEVIKAEAMLCRFCGRELPLKTTPKRAKH